MKRVSTIASGTGIFGRGVVGIFTGPLASLTLLALVGCTPSAGPGGDDGAGGRATGGSGGSKSGGGGGTASGGSGGNASSGGSGGGNAGTGGAIATGGAGPSSGGGAGGGGVGGGGAGGGGGGASTGGAPGASGGIGGGAVDAPVGDVPVNPSPSAGTCTGVTTKFCDDWEKQEAGKAPVGEFTIAAGGGGTVVVDTAQKFSGTKSLHYKTTGGKVMLTFTKQFPFNDLHGRLMLYMPKKPTTGAHWDIIQSHSTANNHWELGGQAGVFELVVDPPDNGIDSATPFPEGDKWYCIQWNFKNPGDTFIAKIDGVFVKPSPVVGRWKSGMWKDLTIGWEIFGSSAADFWIDDLAFGEQEIPCPAK